MGRKNKADNQRVLEATLLPLFLAGPWTKPASLAIAVLLLAEPGID
jgi:hypothetical protein